MHSPSALVVEKEGNASKPLCIEHYNRSIGFVDMSDMTAHSCSIV
jgi:hypothetical protein